MAHRYRDEMVWQNYVLVLVAGSIAAFGTGLGAVPLFWLDGEDIGDRLDVGLWGFAGGLMVSASVFGLLFEAYRQRSNWAFVAGGIVVGVVLVVAAHWLIENYGADYRPRDITEGDYRTIMNILVVLFVHSFPEGIAIGVSFAELDHGHGIHVLGFVVPVVAIVLTVSLAIHNIPEGLATAIPINEVEGVSNFQMWGAAVFTSIPQPIGALVAFYFVRLAQQFLGFGYGLAAGSMIYLVIDDVLPEGMEAGENLPNAAWYLAGGGVIGFVAFAPLLVIL